MTFEATLFGALIAATFGCLYHMFFSDTYLALLGEIIFSIAAFFGGQGVSQIVNIKLIPFGTIDIGMGSVFSLTVLGLIWWFRKKKK